MSDTVFSGTRVLVQSHEPTESRRVQVLVAAIAKGQKETPISTVSDVLQFQELEVGASPAGKGTTTINLQAALNAGIKINEGQFLTFYNTDQIEFLAEITAEANATDNTLTVRALDEEIPAGAKAPFPPYLWDRTGASLNQTFGLSAISTFNTGLNRDGTPQPGESNLDLPGLFYHYNAAMRTLQKAAEEGNFVYVIRMLPVPNSNFQQGEVWMSRASVTQNNLPAALNGNGEANLQVAMLGDVTHLLPVAT